MATSMNVYSNKWSSEMDIEAYSVIQQYHLNSSLVGDVSQSLDETNNCYNFDASCNEDLVEDIKPSKILKTTYISPKLNPFSSSTPPLPLNPQPSSRILSFEKSSLKAMNPSSPNLVFSTKEEVETQEMMIPRGTKRATFTRSQSNSQDHILAERKRREKLTQRFVALSALIPGLKKMDKISVLGDAIKLIKYLQESVKENEKHKKERTMESMVLVKKYHLVLDDDDQHPDFSSSNLPEMEVRVSGEDVLIKIICEKQKDYVIKVMGEIEKLGLSITNSSVMPFGPTLDISIIAKKNSDFDMIIEDLMKSLSSGLSTFM